MMKPDTPKFVSVPVEPTEEMLWAGYKNDVERVPLAIWRAMISAAPKPDCVGVEEAKRELAMALLAKWDANKNFGDIITEIVAEIAERGLLAVKEKAREPCEVCEGTGRLGCLPDDNEHTHPCDTCQPEANKEFQRGVAFAEAVARSR